MNVSVDTIAKPLSMMIEWVQKVPILKMLELCNRLSDFCL